MLAIRSKGNPFGSARVRDPAKERFTTLAEQCEACSGFANLIAFMNRQGRRGLQAQLVGTPAPPLLQFRCEFCKRIRALCAGLRELSCYKFFASRQDIPIVTSQLDRPDIGSLAKLIVGQSRGEREDLAAVQALFTRAGIIPAIGKKLLDRTIENPQVYLIRLLALQFQFERSNGPDSEARKELRDLERQIEYALWPRRSGSDEAFDVPMRFRRGSLTKDQKASVDSAVTMINLTAQELGVADLSQTSVLDIGCGTKFTQAFYGRNVPVKRYHGVDVDPELIGFLASAVKDERFSYRHIDVYNARYYNAGERLSADTNLGVPGETFDLICLFSVFTHLDPSDFQVMLELTRRYIAPTGTLIFTTFIDNELSKDFEDKDPEQPLLMALYREAAVRKFARAAGWSVNKILLPGAQHWVVCKPESASGGSAQFDPANATPSR